MKSNQDQTKIKLFALVFLLSVCLQLLVASRVVAVADLHGDWDHTVEILVAAGLIHLNAVSVFKATENSPPLC